MDRTALITGGSGGLGRAVVAAFASDGWRVVVPDANPVPLDGAETIEADLTDEGDVERAVRSAAEREDAPLRAVVNLVGEPSALSCRSCTTAWGRVPPALGSARPTGFMGPKRGVSRPRSAMTSIGRQPSK